MSWLGSVIAVILGECPCMARRCPLRAIKCIAAKPHSRIAASGVLDGS